MDHLATEPAMAVIGHPAARHDVPKGDPWIVEQLAHARWRNRNNDNPNLKRGRMVFDFASGKVRVEATNSPPAHDDRTRLHASS